MSRRTSIPRTIGIVLFSPLSFLWQLLNLFLLSPWGLLVPLTLLIALFAAQELQKTPCQIARFYADQLETASESEIPQLLDALVRMGTPGVSGLVKGLASHRESVFAASQNVLRQEFNRWQESEQREHHYFVFSEAILQMCNQFSPAAQDEAIRFVDLMMQIRISTVTSSEATAHRQGMIAHCGKIIQQLESARRRRIEPDEKSFAPQSETVASLHQRTGQPVLLASNGQPFVPTSARQEQTNEMLLTDIGGFNFSTAREDRLSAYQKSLQNRQMADRASPEDNEEPSGIAGFSLPQSFPADFEGRIARNISDNAGPSGTIDISEEYRIRKQSESNVGLDNFLTSELLNTPLARVPQLPTSQLMQLLHHLDTAYVESARTTLVSRDGFQESHLKLAWRLYHPVPAVRQEIVAMLPHTPNVQPVVWLTVLLDDPNSDVRYRTASFLATTGDPALQRLLIDRGKRDGDARITSLANRLDESQRSTLWR